MSKVYFEKLKVGDFKFPIRCILDLSDRYIILLEIPSNELFPENIFCVSKRGEMLWQLEKKEMPHPLSAYYGLEYSNNNTLLVYSSSLER
jgi:hypothetical protein